MASKCDICGKSKAFGNNVSHSQVKTKRTWTPNIQSVRTTVAGTPMKVHACTSCIKAGKTVNL